MADQAIRSAIDRLSRGTEDERAKARATGAPTITAEEQLGLRFKPRDRVIDVATGQRGEVHSGRRSDSTGRGVFMVKLATGELTHRDERELELDQPAAPAPVSR